MVQNKEENSQPTASPFIVQIIQSQGKSIQQLTKLNEELVNKTVTILDRFINYDLQKIKQYDEFNRFLMEQKNLEKGIVPPSAQQSQQAEQVNNNPILEILSKLNFLKTPQGDVPPPQSNVNPAVPPAHIPSSSNYESQIHPDFRTDKNTLDYNNFQKQMKIMQEEIERLKNNRGASSIDNDNAGNS